MDPHHDETSAAQIDTGRPQSARIWNYWLGGKDNYPVDREAGDAYVALFPGIVGVARASRYFLIRGIRHLVGQARMRQFLDIGTGLPTVDNTHEVAQRIAPEVKVVYVDNDPLVLAHARALLTGTGQGETRYLDADLHHPEHILGQASAVLDLTRPVAVVLSEILGHIPDEEQAADLVHRLMDPLAPGSYLLLSHGADTDPAMAAAQEIYNASGAVPYLLRSREQVTGLFAGLELVPPGVVPQPHWHPDPGLEQPQLPPGVGWGALARKPGR
ncbi:SAM-dependent methyltransferase [Streptomyces aidingensis]|uniref:S-adenosyl methyltransferase n=1 Tax=Streptomyces aidingensis TaxID=910347 RepID=A0A1I1VAM7_9ACTN|nr:SAM-dependent methyltransferase [Streptomyces aidingensis]SFD79865.1 S-adenosyl methyltransferase [Streptomyces aidingensis]